MGAQSRTLASLKREVGAGPEGSQLPRRVVIDKAGMIGSRQMEGVLTAARKAEAKVVLVGDPDPLRAIEAGAPFRFVADWKKLEAEGERGC